jgi:predicted HTH transcriptional regulator
MDDLQIGTTGEGRESVEDLIEQGENARIEFKQSFLYDVYRDQPNKELKAEVTKEIASLANVEGGVMIIGVEDKTKEIKGLDRDLKLMSDGKDDFELQLNREITNRLGHMMASVYTEVDFETVEDSEICIIWVDPSPEPVYFDGEDGEQFYVRSGSSAEPLTMQEAQEYNDRHYN